MRSNIKKKFLCDYIIKFVYRYARDYYINDSKTASGSREQRTCGDLNLHRAIDDENLENENDDECVSDLDSFYGRKIKKKMRYSEYASLNSNLERSQSLCSVRTYSIRKRINRPEYVESESSCTSFHSGQFLKQHQCHSGLPEHNRTIAKLERDVLHNDVWRNSFSSRRGTNNFVLNPLFEEYK